MRQRIVNLTGENSGWFLFSWIVLSIYLWIVGVLEPLSTDLIDIKMSVLLFLAIGLVAFCASFLLLCVAVKLLGRFKRPAAPTNSLKCGLSIAVLTLAVYSVYYLAYYPGGFSLDCLYQYLQASGQDGYNNWHPVLHTLLFYTLPIKLGLDLSGIIFLQILYFSMAIGYMAHVMAYNRCPKWLLIVYSVYILLNPFIQTYIVYPWKDLAMMISGIPLMAYYIQIICSKGQWLKKPVNMVLFALMTVVCSYLRHNAILFTVPLFAMALLFSGRKIFPKLAMLAVFCLLFGGVKLLYSALEVDEPGGRTLESVGLPAGIWSNVMMNDPESLPEDSRQFMYTFATQQAYSTRYQKGFFTTIKESGCWNKQAFEDVSLGDIIKHTWRCIRFDPLDSAEAFAAQTSVVWTIDGRSRPIVPETMETDLGFSQREFPAAQGITTVLRNTLGRWPVTALFGCYGIINLLLLVVGLALLSKKSFSIFHALPLLIYNFGTMLLLSAPEFRLFIVNLPIWIPLLFLMSIKEGRTLSLKE